MVEETQDAFIAVAHRIVWCTLATVDGRGRPRSRVVHPIWVREGDHLVGWVITRPTPLKRENLAASPFASASYWDPQHDVAVAECAATWGDDLEPAWRALRDAPPPLGYDPATIFPDGAGAAVIRLDPWRLRVVDAQAFAQGRPGLVWRAAGAAPGS